MTTRSFVVPRFSDAAAPLRAEFDALHGARFEHPELRFAWDWFHVPNQYTYLRTRAARYFTSAPFRRLVAALRSFGRERLGCDVLTTAWLSFYVEGCHQRLHADVAHGPWAYSYSLTRWNSRGFRGGETALLREAVLDHWGGAASERGLDRADGAVAADLFEYVEPEFDQLLVFDGRIPHAVERVMGTQDPLDSRVVVHGWYAWPVVRARGALVLDDCLPVLDVARGELERDASDVEGAHGGFVARLSVDASGAVEGVTLIGDQLRTPPSERQRADALRRRAVARFGACIFPPARGATEVDVPCFVRREGA